MAGSSICRFKTICIIGSIEFGKNKKYLKVVTELGITLAIQKIDLVYRGGCLGLKTTIVVSANVGGSRIVGDILKALDVKRDVTDITIDNELQVLSMHKLMTYMNHNANAYIVLSGGLKTPEDVFNIAFWTQFNIHKKPLGLFIDHVV